MKKIIIAFCLIAFHTSTMNAEVKTLYHTNNAGVSFQDKEVEFPFPITVDFKKNKNKSIKNLKTELDKMAPYLLANPDVKIALRTYYGNPKQQQIAWERYEAMCQYLQEKWNIDKNRFLIFIDEKGKLNQFKFELPTKEEINKIENPMEYPPPPKTKD